MKTEKIKSPRKGSVRRLREFQEKNCGKASPELLDILNIQNESEN